MLWLPDAEKNILYFVPFFSYLTLNNIVTLKSGLKVTQANSNWYQFKRLDAVSYSFSITMAVSLTVYEIVGVKI